MDLLQSDAIIELIDNRHLIHCNQCQQNHNKRFGTIEQNMNSMKTDFLDEQKKISNEIKKINLSYTKLLGVAIICTFAGKFISISPEIIPFIKALSPLSLNIINDFYSFLS